MLFQLELLADPNVAELLSFHLHLLQLVVRQVLSFETTLVRASILSQSEEVTKFECQ